MMLLPLQMALVSSCLMGIFRGDHLVFGAPSPPTDNSSSSKFTLDLALGSFDDQYKGCESQMEEKVGQLQQAEFASNNLYAQAWKAAAAAWREKAASASVPKGLKPEYATAIVAYTGERLYRDFNVAIRTAGRSKEEYLSQFRFKAFHFLLTRALQVLLPTNPNKSRCYQVYRGVNNKFTFRAVLAQAIRFGQFTSSTLKKEVAQSFGQAGRKTIFRITTCLGVYVKQFSYFPEEEEVLIPPYERFAFVSSKEEGDTTWIQLRSEGEFSHYNCEYVKGSKP
ncbi:erythroblast NAD(P)(+)--arginine ADP-ribosyltransferase-like [Hemicordylus capensis]|uniref:erythroblast NAD(P)(+)--arginine ADP-ribosyltransferase-like n=1 Tax=Hemicordylus capensis TaxID=884348 RepID=UPI002302475E|nr:erythroblast NAD(P)(+)--arginine ADP-ribosyltransferase-like [Hemicordylus capensis]